MADTETKKALRGLIGPLIFAGCALGFLYLVFLLPSSPEPEPRQMSEQETNIAIARRACKDLIQGQLNDPNSAEWGNVSLWPAGPQTDDPSRLLVQPEIRAKNAFGALVLTRFQCTFAVKEGELSFLDLKEY